MDRREAERIYALGKEAVIEALLGMDARLKALEQQVASLRQNSTNSSKPPSSDGPRVMRAKKEGSSRPAGGQKGHKGSRRALLPVEQMDHVQDLYPKVCERCGASLPVTGHSSPVLRHQVFDLPELEPVKTEYRLHETLCSCGHRSRASLPPAVASTQFGPRVHAAIAYLSSVHRSTRRGMVEIMNTLFGLDLSLGSVCNALERVSPELEPVSEDIRESLKESLVLNIDETGWKSKGERRYLWAFVSPLAVFFSVAASRGSKVLKAILGERFHGVIGSDDHSAYRRYHKEGRRQLCWAHLIRKLKGLQESRSSPDASRFAGNCLRETGKLFGCWHAFRQGAISREELSGATHLIRARLKHACLTYRSSSDGAVRTRAERMLANWPHLFTFLTHEGVEPTNNAAERALRPAVQWRKISFGNQSVQGEHLTGRILTVTRTCRLQGRNAFHFLAQVMEAAFAGTARPSLVQQISPRWTVTAADIERFALSR